MVKLDRYKPISDEVLKNELRARRAEQCFPIVNRGKCWYDLLTSEQYAELAKWYQAWLDITETYEMPIKPIWLDGKIENDTEVL